MKTALPILAVSLAVLHVGSPIALGAETLPGQPALANAGSGCPANATRSVAVADTSVLVASSGDATAKPVNRFRYNYMQAATGPVIAGHTAASGCAMSIAASGSDND